MRDKLAAPVRLKRFIFNQMKNSSLALKNGSANDAKRRGPPRDEVRREGERMSSPRPQIAKGNRTAGEPALTGPLEAARLQPEK